MAFTLVCGFPTVDGAYPPLFSLEVKPGDLTSKVYYEIGHIIDIQIKDFALYKSDLPTSPYHDRIDRMVSWLHQHSGLKPLDYGTKLAEVFSATERLDVDKFHVIVATPESMEMAEGLGDPNFKYRNDVKKRVVSHIATLAPKLSPSEVVENERNVAEVFGGSAPHIHMGRSNDFPIAIFSPILARLQQRLENLDQVDVDPDDVIIALSYIEAATAFYDDEKQRQAAMQRDIAKVIGGEPSWQPKLNPGGSQSLQPDGVWWTLEFAVVILELKNTIGLGGHAVLQALVDFAHIVSSAKCKEYLDRTVFPVILVGMTANRLEVSIAICLAGEVFANQILSIDVSTGIAVTHESLRLARIFQALSECRVALEMHYSGLRAPDAMEQLCFPIPTVVHTSASLPKITFTHFMWNGERTTIPLLLGNALTLMYEATMDHQDQRKQVVVKFTARYNADAHRLLADAHLAPELYFCEKVVGGLYMVIMERVPGKNLYQAQDAREPLTTGIVNQVADAIHRLHQENIVFGDLRTPNILLPDSQPDSAILVDFDWAGSDGVARYPVTLNKKWNWHKDVRPYSHMKMEHDNWQVQKLRQLCNA